MTRISCVCMFAFALIGCAHTEPEAIWLSDAARACEVGTHASNTTQLELAAVALELVLSAPAPQGLAPEHRRAVRQDVAYVLARVQLRRSRPQDAHDVAQRGLREGDAGSLFANNLHLMNALALRALGHDAEADAELTSLR